MIKKHQKKGVYFYINRAKIALKTAFRAFLGSILPYFIVLVSKRKYRQC